MTDELTLTKGSPNRIHRSRITPSRLLLSGSNKPNRFGREKMNVDVLAFLKS
jgi:hypothetical protein